MEIENGPTEFSLGSHYLGYEGWAKENLYTLCVKDLEKADKLKQSLPPGLTVKDI